MKGEQEKILFQRQPQTGIEFQMLTCQTKELQVCINYMYLKFCCSDVEYIDKTITNQDILFVETEYL